MTEDDTEDEDDEDDEDDGFEEELLEHKPTEPAPLYGMA